MKSINKHFNKTLDLYKLEEDGAKLTYSYAETIPCNVQPVDGSFIQDSTGMYAKGFYVFMDYREIKEGDQLRNTENNLNLRVVSVENFDIGGAKKHTEVVARAFDNNAIA